MTIKTALLASLPALFLATLTHAATVSTVLPVTAKGQDFDYVQSLSTGYAGGSGTLRITMNGDFTEPSERATFTFGTLAGALTLAWVNSTTFVWSNTLSGVTLTSASGVSTAKNFDGVLSYVFDLSAAAMSTLMSSGSISGTVDLANAVKPSAKFDADYISIAFDYSGVAASTQFKAASAPLPAVPSPATGVLLASVLCIFAGIRRKSARSR